ncbi:hypothetical protein LTSESEN_0217 [Salmonella enterica subsp. enterica serovar Senftenberg str. A4-543]|uniref:Uncharacterized protein n=1 Tax=Salmonella enterica subsp. enterica serovar Senftenberg str. A4-543 TaxID=913082 RepID=G5QUF1_SALSE|nr:hypothetical protein LTSESEN_0217 [Salmonella enterica subsp. enterica serovar Senftenberg str. A4-543]
MRMFQMKLLHFSLSKTNKKYRFIAFLLIREKKISLFC